MREPEMPTAAEVVRGLLREGTHDLAGCIERELRRRGHPPEEPSRAARTPERCDRCGGLKDDGAAPDNGARVCRCGGRKRRLLSYLDAADPERSMLLETLDASEPTMAAALAEARRLVSGGRRRGMLLMGPPGRGKTHLMVGTARALLARDGNAGYYNFVRLISRVQDSYSGSGGETRGAIVGSVASHDVVLLDDFGKEHSSTNVESIVYELFDALHSARATLVVATNVPAVGDGGYRGPTLSERYDEAVRSRLKAMCGRLVLKGEDRRPEAWEW